MVGSIIAAVVQAIIGSIIGLFEKKDAKENEFAAVALQHQRESTVQAQNVEVAVEKAQVTVRPVVTKTEALAALGFSLILLCLCGLSGCTLRPQVVSSGDEQKPVIRTRAKERSMLDGPEQLTEREQRVIGYTTELRTAVGEYNKWAVESNKKNKFPPGDSSPEGWEVILPKPPAVPETAPVTAPAPKPKP